MIPPPKPSDPQQPPGESKAASNTLGAAIKSVLVDLFQYFQQRTGQRSSLARSAPTAGRSAQQWVPGHHCVGTCAELARRPAIH